MLGRLSTSLRVTLYLCSASVLVYTWLVSRKTRQIAQENAELRAEQRELIHAASRPILIRGFDLPLDEGVVRIGELRGRISSKAHKRLLLIYSGGCEACSRQIPIWETILKDAQIAGVETWLIRLDGDGRLDLPLCHALEAGGYPFRMVQVLKRLPFVVLTGILVSPTTLLTDVSQGKQTVRFIAGGLMSPDHAKVLLDTLRSEGPPQSTQAILGAAGSPNDRH
ncbi:MAG: hypothetical protein KatS3mg082_2454 [Nitrospiraceae bacterium]|nr:MAG: hypothetical protein KatS3mg082_2454 [Nitrospiraceae bacterium]